MLSEQQKALILNHLGLARFMARKFRNNEYLSYDDLLGIANLALVRAAAAFPESDACRSGVPFKTFAAKYMRIALLTALRESLPVHVPQEANLRAGIFNQAEAARIARGDDRMSDAELAATLGWTEDQARRIRRLVPALHAGMSLDVPVEGPDGDEEPFGNFFEDPEEDVEAEVLDRLAREEELERLRGIIAGLPHSMKLAISLRFGLHTPKCERITIAEVLSVFIGMGCVTCTALKRVREHAGVAGAGESRGYSLDDCYARKGAAAKAKERRGADLWRRIASGEEEIPILCEQ
ncbi:MAG: hypothetical protein HPY52_07885 [Firmicutes bacterium]|nr:hypothetical protein [Bacillota bacterium]